MRESFQVQILAPVGSNCDVEKYNLNRLQQDLVSKQGTVDTCDPTGAKQRRQEVLTREWNQFWSEKETVFQLEEKEFQKNIEILRNGMRSLTPMDNYIQELEKEIHSQKTELKQYEHSVRAGRRRFLDNHPLEKVSNVFGIHTTDDKILLTFWISYLLLIVTLTFVLVSSYSDILGLDTVPKKIAFDIFLIGTLYGIAYFFISKFA